MKRLLITLGVSLLSFVSLGAYADASIGVIDMQKVFQSTPQIKQINDGLKKQFADRKNKLDGMGKQLQADIQTYEKNKSVMSKSSLTSLREKVTQEQQQLQKEGMQFQKDVYAAQSKQTKVFLEQIKGIVKNIASAEHLQVVLPKGNLLYSTDNIDITSKVISQLQKS